jgi:DNA processing protein
MTVDRASSYASPMSSGSMEEQAALVALLQARPGRMSWPEITAEVVEAGSAIEVWDRLVPAALMAAPGDVSPLTAADEIQRWAGEGCRLVSILDADYPARLRGIHQAPPVLFARGLMVRDEVAVSMVGSREASESGIALAAELARAFVARSITVVSGLARGIDTAAHRAALKAGGRTVAVVGTGINKTYPAENRSLQDEIATHGLVLSQFWPDAPPRKQNFLMRNATMSGYGHATVVVEAGEYSGARSQARMAVEHGRQVILTDQVVARTQWAQALLGRPGVHVASSVGSVLGVVEGIVAMWDEIQRLVAS